MRFFVSWKAVPAALALCTLALGADDAHAGPTPAQACAIAKNKAAVKKVAARSKCWQKAIASGEAAASPECLAAAESKFVAAITKAESKGGCLTTGDAAAISGAADACIDGIVETTPPSTTTTTTTAEPTTSTTLEQTLWYEDADGDGSPNAAVSQYSATPIDGWIPSWAGVPFDCDDNDPARFPGKPENCDLVADSDCNAATPDCPTGCNAYQRPSGNLYMFCSTPRDWLTASSYCNGGRRLVKIDDAAEDSFVWAIATYYFGSGSGYYWTGGSYGLSGWQWPDGTPMSYTHWGSGEPAGPNKLQVSRANATWRSVFQSDLAPYVCESY